MFEQNTSNVFKQVAQGFGGRVHFNVPKGLDPFQGPGPLVGSAETSTFGGAEK